MAYEAKIGPSFWADRDIKQLAPDEKLAFLWLLTNSTRNNIGLSKLTEEQFQFDTGLSLDPIHTVCQKLGRGITYTDRNHTLWILSLNFLAHNISGNQFKPESTVGRMICREASALPEPLREAFLKRYPHLSHTVSLLSQTVGGKVTVSIPPMNCTELPCTDNPPTASGNSFSEVPGDDEVLAYAATWPGEPTSGAPKMDPAWVAAWLARMNARSGEWPSRWDRALIAAWRADFRHWPKANQTGGYPKNGGEKPLSEWALKQRRDALEKQIATHPANEDSAAWMGEATAAETAELETLRAELRELSGVAA